MRADSIRTPTLVCIEPWCEPSENMFHNPTSRGFWTLLSRDGKVLISRFWIPTGRVRLTLLYLVRTATTQSASRIGSWNRSRRVVIGTFTGGPNWRVRRQKEGIPNHARPLMQENCGTRWRTLLGLVLTLVSNMTPQSTSGTPALREGESTVPTLAPSTCSSMTLPAI